MKTLAYKVNIEKLFNIQDTNIEKINREAEERIQQGIRNKTKLLKIALPFIHGVLALHNRKCRNTNTTTTGKDGLLGISKVDIDRKIDFIVNTDHHLIWESNYNTLVFDIGHKKVKIWLHDDGKYIHNKNMEYSMTTIGDKVYAESVEHELEHIARYCARFTDEW